MDLQEMSDRAEIADLVVRYTRALDEQRWDDFDALFTDDAFIDYTVFGGTAGDLAATKKFLAESMPIFTKTQHMLGLPAITVDGDRATSVTPCHNPMLLGSGRDAKVMVCSLWYHHELARTPDGWRIARLSEERNFMTMLEGGDITAG
ncbi:MAG TPA: nuclear transport factor 2 family protein [Acidimicrobiales bacterium]|nr:nuclear transport factor 2 family protein [Acidimicrobiales bacterium]